MSVNADDVTPSSIKKIANKIIAHGVPIIPGAAFMLAYLNDLCIIGVPGCLVKYKTTGRQIGRATCRERV